ncbi:MAG TPA: MBL fold metallo-hydrolase [Verrucomicrobiae bacterium]|nr:MBL fold metallo-hydrolase [Verrucomicrobiae bacterium]
MSPDLIHEILPVGVLQCNCMILGDPLSREALVVDPGDETDRILEILRRHRLNVRAIVSTHTHIDHVGGLASLYRATQAPVLIHEADLELYRHLDVQAQWVGIPTPETMRLRDFVAEGDRIRWGSYFADVLYTPGHTPGSISLVVGHNDAPAGGESQPAKDTSASASAHLGRLISGDTLFHRSIGRTDLPGGSFPQILGSIRDKLYTLPEETLVYPGHGEPTTIGAEREANPFVRP